jgi:hypothetical protein
VLDLDLEPDLVRLIRQHAGDIWGAAPERVLGELALTLAVPGTEEALCLLARLDLLKHLLPEVEALRGVPYALPPGGPPLRDAYGQTAATVRALDDVLADPVPLLGVPWASVGPRMARPVDGVLSRPAALRLAALLLEVGRVPARSSTAAGPDVFWGHAALGASLARDVVGRLRCSRAASGLVVKTVGEHGIASETAAAGPPPPRALVGALWRLAPWEPEVLLVSWAATEAAARALPDGTGGPPKPSTGAAARAAFFWRCGTIDAPVASRPSPWTGTTSCVRSVSPPGPVWAGCSVRPRWPGRLASFPTGRRP